MSLVPQALNAADRPGFDVKVINLVEPTLMSEAGHCFSFATALCRAADPDQGFRIWIDRHAEVDFPGVKVEVCRHFSRRLRRLQSLLLYRRLLRTSEKLFITTAGRGDLLMLDWAASAVIPPDKVYLYVHWFHTNEKKAETLRRIALRQPNLVILGPTASVIAPFQATGFMRALVVPYPVLAAAQPITSYGFRHLLYAGAARHDKGFSHVVDLVAHLQSNHLDIPVTLQISAEHFGKYDAPTQADIQRLKRLSYPHLRIIPETLSAREYADQFNGAICLQFYDRGDFADRISGVTLDAFQAGSPIVTTEGTWMARMAERFAAGVAMEVFSPPGVFAAIQSLIAQYPAYQAHARQAGEVLRAENDATLLYRAITG